MRVSLDGGGTWQKAREGVRIEIDVPTDEGEDQLMHFNFTGEGLVVDLWSSGTTYECLATFCNTDYELKDFLFS